MASVADDDAQNKPKEIPQGNNAGGTELNQESGPNGTGDQPFVAEADADGQLGVNQGAPIETAAAPQEQPDASKPGSLQLPVRAYLESTGKRAR